MPLGWKPWLAISIGFCALILAITRPYNYVDSLNYALHIVSFPSPGPNGGPDAFWDFGHALWRPLGYVVWSVFRAPLNAAFPSDPALGAGAVLIGFNVVGAFVSTIFLFLIAARVTNKAWVAAAVSIGFMSTDAAMNYSTSGTAYVFGESLLIVALYLLLRAIQEDRLTLGRGLGAGALMGLAVGIWFPFCLPVPGLLCFALLWPGPTGRNLRARFRFLLPVLLSSGVILLAVYGGVMTGARIESIAEARQWASRNRYGIDPHNGYLRVPAGVTRAFFYLGQDSVVWKRLLFGGSGGRPGIGAAISSGLWKAAIVFLVLGWLVLRLCLSARDRTLLICLAVTALPILYFAAFLFDPGPPERNYPIFPLLFLAFACILAGKAATRLDRAIPLAFFAAMLAVNASAMWRFDGDRGFEDAIARLNTVNPHVTPNDRILVVSFPDSVARFVTARPFDPASRNRYLVYIVIETGTKQGGEWKQHLAETALNSWSHGGHLWVSLRLLAPSPKPEWGWVEADDSRIPWPSVSGFFKNLDMLPAFGGSDGFAELAPSERNQNLFRSLAAQ